MPDPTIFVVEPDQPSQQVVCEVAEAMRVSCECYVTGEQFLETYLPCRPGCLVSELRLSGIDGLQLQQSLSNDHISLPVIFVTAHAKTSLVVRAMQDGASTVLEKPPTRPQLWDEIHQAIMRDARVRSVKARRDEMHRRLSWLTPKERQVLDLMLAGQANKIAAKRLNVSIRTVEARRQQVFKKTQTDSVAELVKMVLELQAEQEAIC